MATHQSTKAAKEFMIHYGTALLKSTPDAINQALTYWWSSNRKSYPLAKLPDVRQNVLSTIEYNKANPNRK